jgi:RNA polymerase sigma-70 factor (ECF subfamily)
MVRVGRGDREAFQAVFERYRDEIHAFLARMVHDAVAAEDLTQETFLRVFREAGRYDPCRPLEPWIYRIARNLAVDWLRSRKRKPETSLTGPDETTIDAEDPARGPVEVAAEREREALLREGLSRLRPGQREIFVLIDLEGLKYEQVADMLGISVKAVGARLRKARRRFLNWAEPNEKRLLGEAGGPA